jgi:hypothetical protein
VFVAGCVVFGYCVSAHGCCGGGLVVDHDSEMINYQYAKDLEERDYALAEGKADASWSNKEHMDILKHYTDTRDDVPDGLRRRKWGLFSKVLPLSFLQNSDLFTIDLFSSLSRLNSLMGKPSHRISFDDIDDLDQVDFFVFLNAKRAVGNPNPIYNERGMQATQMIFRQGVSASPVKKRGFGIRSAIGKFF